MALGVNLEYSLGNNFPAFLAYPAIDARPTYLATGLLGIIVFIALILMARLMARLYAEPTQKIGLFLNTKSSTVLALNAAFLGYGMLLVAMSRPIYLHYFVVAFSLPALWLAWIAQAGSSSGCARSLANSRRLLTALVLVQASLTLLFLSYIHEAQIIDGDYGVAYGSQINSPAGLE